MQSNVRMKTLFSKKVPYYNGGTLLVPGGRYKKPPPPPPPPPPIDTCCAKIHNLITSTTVLQVLSYFEQYAAGNFDFVNSALTADLYSELSEELYELKQPLCPDYELIRAYICKSFEELFQCTMQNVLLQNVTSNLAAANIKLQIMNNFNSLKAYLLAWKNPHASLLGNIEVTAQAYTVKPEYLIYIQTYGYPETNVFDPDLLGAIVAKLELNSETEET